MDFFGPGIERIYQGVIVDVIKQVKEEFEDEGVGEDVLLQLKKSWQLKLIQSDVLNIGPHATRKPNRPNDVKPQMPKIKKEVFDHHVSQKLVPVKKERDTTIKLGGAKNMDDSSSEDEEDSGNEDINQLRTFAKLEDNNSDAEDALQEDPLNSGDDASSEEDTAEAYDVPNVVICQYEKVGRGGKKWNFVLSQGVMNIEGKDYCFHKCTGDADW